MAISTDYANPVTVNGFSCRNCTDVDNAKKHIDPAHPRSGPYDINARTDPTQPAAVRFGGALSALNKTIDAPGQLSAATERAQPGSQLDLKV
jgi:hypothetical protein